MAISFNTIPLSLNTPGQFVEFDNSRAVKGLTLAPHTALLLGLKLAAGSAAQDVPVRVSSPDAAIGLFGQHSQLAQMVAAYKELDSLTEVWAIPLAENVGGTAAAGTIAFTGPATAAGSVVVYVDGRRVEVAVASGATATAIAASVDAAIDELLSSPVTASNVTGTLTLTAKHKGTYGNDIKIGHSLNPGEKLPAGISAVVTQPVGGATDYTLTAAVAAMGEDWYNTIVGGFTTKLLADVVTAELESRWAGLRQIEGVLFTGRKSTQATLTTYGNTLNSLTGVTAGSEATALSPSSWEIAARTAAVDVIQTLSDPAAPRTGLGLGLAYSAPRGARFTRAEQDILLSDGISTLLATSDGKLAVQRLVTNYQTNGLGVADPSYKDLPNVRTLSLLRYTLRTRIAQKFGRYKLADDGARIAPGQKIATPSVIRAEIVAIFRLWEEMGLVENFDQFASELLVERDVNDPNRVNAIIPPDLINSFLIFAAQIQFLR